MRTLLLLLAAALLAAPLPAADIPYGEIRVNPEKFKNDAVSYQNRYVGHLPNVPPYMAASGFDAEKYHVFAVGSIHLPVLGRKSPGLDSTLAGLKPGDLVRVSGKVKEFRQTPGHKFHSPYYLELGEIVFVESRPETPGQPPLRPRLQRE